MIRLKRFFLFNSKTGSPEFVELAPDLVEAPTHFGEFDYLECSTHAEYEDLVLGNKIPTRDIEYYDLLQTISTISDLSLEKEKTLVLSFIETVTKEEISVKSLDSLKMAHRRKRRRVDIGTSMQTDASKGKDPDEIPEFDCLNTKQNFKVLSCSPRVAVMIGQWISSLQPTASSKVVCTHYCVI